MFCYQRKYYSEVEVINSVEEFTLTWDWYLSYNNASAKIRNNYQNHQGFAEQFLLCPKGRSDEEAADLVDDGRDEPGEDGGIDGSKGCPAP